MRQWQGRVVSVKMTKTAVVEVIRRVRHPIYQKVYTRKKKYHVHDEFGVDEGDLVKFVSTRPISKTKSWKIIEKVKR